MKQKHDYQKMYAQYILENTKSLRAYCSKYSLNYTVISRNFKKLNFQLKDYISDRTYTKQEIEIIYRNHYDNYLSFKELSNKYKISKQLLYRNFKYYGFKVHSNLNKSNVIQKGFLQNIDTPLKAYYLGWMYSDGCVGKDLQLSIQADDIDILKLFQLNFGGNMYFQKRRKITHKDQYSLRIPSQPDIQFIINHGCNRRKSSKGMTFPILNNNLYRYFILGFFDGDGSIYSSGRNKTIKFFSIDKIFLERINNHLISIGCINPRWDSIGNVYVLLYGNSESRKKIMEYFYRDNPYFLKRKKEKFYKLVTPRELFDLKVIQPRND